MTFYDPNFTQAEPVKASDKPIYGARLPPIDHLTEGELITLLDMVISRLPPTKMSNLNLEDELVLQLYRAKDLLAKTIDQEETPANQKAQVMNAVSSVISQLIQLQERLYNAERFKAMEAIMIKSIQLMPKEAAEHFVDEYEKLGDGL